MVGCGRINTVRQVGEMEETRTAHLLLHIPSVGLPLLPPSPPASTFLGSPSGPLVISSMLTVQLKRLK